MQGIAKPGNYMGDRWWGSWASLEMVHEDFPKDKVTGKIPQD
jgi:hypothetical protein